MSDERLGFELDIDVDAHRLPQTVQHLALMEQRLTRLDGVIDRFERGTRSMDSAAGRMRNVAGSITELSSAIGLLSRGLSVGAAAWSAFDRGGDFAIKAMGERSASIRAYTQLLGGDKKGAALEYYRAQEFSQKTDFSSLQIEQAQARLMAQGFRDKDLYATLFSAADLAAIMPGDKNQTLERVTMALAQIKGKGKLQGEELTGQLAEAGLNTSLVKQQIAKSLGIKVGDVDKRMSKGEISSDVAIPAIQRAILAQLGTSKAGEFATGSAGSLTALISNRDEALQNLLKGFDADANLPAMDRYKKALQEQGKLFDINSKTGRELSLVIQDLSNAAVDAKSGWAEFTSGFIESFADSYNREARRTGRDFEGDAARASDALERLGRSLGALGVVAATAAGNTNNVIGKAANLFNNSIEQESALLRLLSEGKAGAAAWEAAKLTLPGRVIGGASDAAGRAIGRYAYGYDYDQALPDSGLEMRQAEKNLRREMADFGTDAGTAKGGGAVYKSPFSFELKNNIRARAVKKAEEAKKSGSSPYRGVFWDYQFDGSIGVWAKPPSVESLSQQQMIEVRGMTAAMQTANGQPMVNNFYIQGYGKDKGELTKEIVNVLGRVARSPR